MNNATNTMTESETPAAPSIEPGANVTIERDRKLGHAEWNAFLERNGGSFYHMSQWKDVNTASFGHKTFELTARDGDTIVGVLPLVLVESRLFGRILCSVPFVNFGGPISSSDGVKAALVRAAAKLADELKVDYLELRSTQQLATDLPVSLRKISMTVELAPDPETLWASYTSKHRKNVKRAYKHGLEVTVGGIELLSEFYAVMEESWHMLGTPMYDRAYFKRVLKTFPDNTRVFACRRGQEPVAVALTGYFNGVVEGLWAGGRPLARELDANYVLYWEMIKDSCTRGFRSFHLGRSTADSGGEEFKRRWNANTEQLYWYFHVPGGGPMPGLNVDNPKYRLAIKTWRRLPVWLIRPIGARLAPYIP